MPVSPPFSPQFPIRSADDVARLTAQPLASAYTAQSTYDIFCQSATAFGERAALTFLSDVTATQATQSWTYRELLAGIHRCANALHHLGLRPGDAVAVMLPGCLEYQLALWGGEAAGIVQPLNPLLAPEKLAALVNATQAKVLIAWGTADDAGIWSKAVQLAQACPSLHTVLRVAPAWAGVPIGELNDSTLDFQALLDAQPADRLLSQRLFHPQDIAAYFHTGGTTGAPKLARHTHGAQVFSAWASVQMQGVTPKDVTLNGYPLFHVAGVLPVSLAALSAGMHVIVPTTGLFRNRAVIAHYWQLVERYQVTVVSAVPTVLAALTQVPLAGANIASLRYCRTGAAPLSPELAARFKALFGLHVHESYGMTETAGIASITPPGVESVAGSVGFALPHTQIRIGKVGALEQTMPLGEVGEVLYQAPNVFSGYLDWPASQQPFTPEGWLITGDLGYIDALGKLKLTGRSKDLIIRGGHNIDPQMIEDALASHPAVALSAAVGMADAYAGELPVAFATLLPGAQVSEAELLAHTCARVDEAPAKPKWVKIIATMPQTNVGKIYKPDLREMADALGHEG